MSLRQAQHKAVTRNSSTSRLISQATTFPVTTSLGISSFPETAQELDVFREKADAALYKAKKEGRNRVAHVD